MISTSPVPPQGEEPVTLPERSFPRLVAAGATLAEMPRNSARSFCCGAGGARMWMEEKVGKRINLERVDEAISTGAETVVTACPFCSIMLGDGLTARQSDWKGAETQTMDVARMLLASVKGDQ